MSSRWPASRDVLILGTHLDAFFFLLKNKLKFSEIFVIIYIENERRK
jgi:hypothetical protein